MKHCLNKEVFFLSHEEEEKKYININKSPKLNGKVFRVFCCVTLVQFLFPRFIIRIRISLSGSDFLYRSDVISPALLNLSAANAFDVSGEEPVVEQEPAAVAVALKRSHPLRNFFVVQLTKLE